MDAIQLAKAEVAAAECARAEQVEAERKSAVAEERAAAAHTSAKVEAARAAEDAAAAERARRKLDKAERDIQAWRDACHRLKEQRQRVSGANTVPVSTSRSTGAHRKQVADLQTRNSELVLISYAFLCSSSFFMYRHKRQYDSHSGMCHESEKNMDIAHLSSKPKIDNCKKQRYSCRNVQ